MISIDEKERILKFIKNPIKTGIWETIFEWNNDNEIVSKIRGESIIIDNRLISTIVTPIMILEIFNFFVQKKIIKKKDFIDFLLKPDSLKHIDNNVLESLKNNFKNFDEIYNLIRVYDNNIIIEKEYANILQQPHSLNPENYNNMFIILSTDKKISVMHLKLVDRSY